MRKGDPVMLTSGGQQMTVQDVRKNGKVLCIWTYRGKFHSKVVDAELLVPAQRPPTIEDIVRRMGGAPEDAEHDDA